MRVAVIGRTEILYNTAQLLYSTGHSIACILTAKEAPEYTRKAEDFRVLAERWGVPFAQGGRISEHQSFLQNSEADIAVSVNYTGILPQSVIDLFQFGVLNAHGGDLPRYRGNACQAWAILNGEERIGLCIHKMVGDELDSGDIITRDYLPINYATKVTQVWEWMVLRIPELMLESVSKIAANPDYILERQSRVPSNILRCYPRRPEDGRINWSMSAIDILRLINASNKPYAGAFCNFEGEKLIVWDAEIVEDGEVFCAVPGQVTRIGEGFVEVACGKYNVSEMGKIRIIEIEFHGKSIAPNLIIQSIRKRLS